MHTITELSQYTLQNPPVVALKRKPEVEDAYMKFIKKPENRSGFLDSIKLKMTQREFYLVDNDYPYWTQPDVKHMVCWFTHTNPYEILGSLKAKYNIVACWQNIPSNCSIQEIKHLHVFILED